MNRDTTYCLPSVVVVVVVLVSGLILPCSECAYDIEEILCLWITVLDKQNFAFEPHHSTKAWKRQLCPKFTIKVTRKGLYINDND